MTDICDDQGLETLYPLLAGDEPLPSGGPAPPTVGVGPLPSTTEVRPRGRWAPPLQPCAVESPQDLWPQQREPPRGKRHGQVAKPTAP